MTTTISPLISALVILLSAFNVPAQNSIRVERRSFIYTEAEKQAHEDLLHAEKEGAIEAMRQEEPRTAPVDYSSRSVGEIPLQEGVSPSGARTYQIPIPTASGYTFVPSVSLGYNSQASDGWVGYGWDIQGVSSITLISKSKYYHNKTKGANVYNKEAVFALDGVPLIANTQTETSSDYPFVTATGNILVSATYYMGYATQFEALYPNGMRAIYGFGYVVANNYHTYPVTEMTDLDGNKVTYVYQQDSNHGNHRLDAIRYGYDSSDNYHCEIAFDYDNIASYVPKYYAGKQTNKLSRLKSITSKDGNSVICRYPLTYEQKGGAWLLSQVDCVSGTDSLRPLQFRHDSYTDQQIQTPGCLTLDDSLSFSGTFAPGDTNLVYKRGKFLYRTYNDGLIIYPYYPNYESLNISPAYYTFGSMYPANQEILFIASLRDGATPDASITTGSGFQTIEAVDVDGDGLDELVKINVSTTYFNSDNGLTITVYKSNLLGVPVQSAQFTVQMSGSVNSGPYYSPYRREYFWGDFMGNGKVQLLAIAYDKNYNSVHNFNQVCYVTLIDIAGQTKRCDYQWYTFPENGPQRLLAIDLDNDSQTELCYATDSGLSVNRFGTSSFAFEKLYTNVTASTFTSDVHPVYITDLNGDGYIDIVSAPSVNVGSSWTSLSFTGSAFVSAYRSICSRDADDSFFFIDLNRDGYADLVKISGSSLTTYRNQDGTGFEGAQSAPTSIANAKGVLQCNVVDRFGMSAFIKIDGTKVYGYEYTVMTPILRHLTKSVDSYGRLLVNSYDYLPSHSLYWTDPGATVSNADGYAFRTLPVYVLEGDDAFTDESMDEQYRDASYRYHDGVVHNWGLGFCGFSKSISNIRRGSHGIQTTAIYNPQKRGVLVSSATFNGQSGTDVSWVTNEYDNNTSNGVLNPRLTLSVATDALTGITTTTTYTYGDYDLPTQILTSRAVGSATPLTQKVKRTYEHSLSGSKYVVGALKTESLITEADSTNQLAWEEKTVYTYDTNYHPIESKRYVGKSGIERPPIIDGEPLRASGFTQYEADNLVSTTRRTYDSHGNVTSEKSAPYGATEFVGDTLVYDSSGRYLVSKTDALGHTTTYSGYNKFGKPTSVTDYRNRTTTYTYDSWGNLTQTSYADGGVEQTTTAWGGDGLYTVTSTATGEPEAVTHYDALGREIKSEVKRFDGVWQFVNKEYDSRGRLSRVSLPYRATTGVTGPSYWNTYHYDIYDRPDSLCEASGRVTRWSYNGTSTTTVKDSIAITKTTDAMGRLVSVSDLGGMTTYALRDDGQPSSITAPGDVVTTFTYDDYGRQIQMTDPSLGTETDSYTWNSDGSSQFTHTNRNGTVTTYKDKYGRTTQIQRANEFNTTYTYDTYGRLSSVSSTNSTSKEYTYDSYDRIATFKESVPYGKWLQKIYTYSTGSVLSSIAYTSQSGYITTETYTYANGHNTGITIPGTPGGNSITVWSLVSENDLGQPTEITTGGINREYGYTAFGLPTYRKMDGGYIQNFSFQFDPKKGNLLQRSGYLYNYTETFGYDGLNRLTEITKGNTTRQIVYANNGNITSIDGVGTLIYGGGTGVSPYEVTGLTPEQGQPSYRQRTVTYNSFDRPSYVVENTMDYPEANFYYNADGERVFADIRWIDGTLHWQSYAGGRYEHDDCYGSVTERLYLGGDAYSAPMVLQKAPSGSWTLYNIGRDYLGSITHITDAAGANIIAQYRYDPWGRLVDPSTGTPYAPGSEPTLFLGRGFTSHEHLTKLGIIYANARLYDPLLGRFLSPDPYVQDPDFSQNYNRYSYCLNNPLKYTDESGEIIQVIIGAIVGGYFNWLANGSDFSWNGVWYFTIGAAMGALSGGLSMFSTAALAGISGVAAGAMAGGILGAATGGMTGLLSNGLNNLVAGKTFMDGSDRAVLSGMGMGALSGTLGGAITGGKNAYDAGKNVWWGNDVKYGRSQWSLINLEKPLVYTSPVSHNLGVQKGECVLRCLEKFSRSYGHDEYDFDYWLAQNDNVRGVHPSRVSKLINSSGKFGSEQLGVSADNIISAFKNDQRVMFGFASDDGLHAVMINKIKVWVDGTYKIYFKETSPVRIVARSALVQPNRIFDKYPSSLIWTFFKK